MNSLCDSLLRASFNVQSTRSSPFSYTVSITVGSPGAAFFQLGTDERMPLLYRPGVLDAPRGVCRTKQDDGVAVLHVLFKKFETSVMGRLEPPDDDRVTSVTEYALAFQHHYWSKLAFHSCNTSVN